MTANMLRRARRAAWTEEPEWVVWLVVAVLLGIGLLVRWTVQGRTESYDESGIRFRYPAAWGRLQTEEAFDVVAVGESLESSLLPASVHVRQMPVTEISTTAQSMGDLALKWTNQRKDQLLAYRVFAIEPLSLGGKDAVRIDYAYVADAMLGGPGGAPIVARGEDILLRDADTVTVASFVTDNSTYESQRALGQRILGSLEVN